MFCYDMSSKGDEDQVIVEKIRNYPDLTVNDCSASKLLVSTQNTTTVSAGSTKNTSKSNHSISIVSTSGGQNFDETQTTCAELRQAAMERKLPPYTNVTAKQIPNRGSKMNQSKTPPKTTPQKLVVSHEKSVSESSVSSTPIINNKSVTVETRTNSNFNTVPASRTAHTSVVQPKGDKTILFNASTTSCETNCAATPKALQDQVLPQPSNKSPNDVFERNIHKNVLTLTPCSSTSKTASVVKETKTSPVTTVTKTVSASPALKNSTPSKDCVNFNSSPKSIGKPDVHSLSPSNVKTTVVNTAKPVVISTSELSSRNLFGKSSSVDNISSPSKVKDVTSTISSSDCDSRDLYLNSKSIPSKTVPSTISSCISKINAKTTSISVSSGSSQTKKPVISESVPIPTVPATLSNNRLAMISSMSDSKNRKIMDALNSGSNFNLTDSVTISNQPVQVVHSGTDSKIGNVSGETLIQPFLKQTIGIISPGNCGNFRGKSGNAEIVGGGNPNQSGSSPRESSTSVTRELRSSKKESVTLLRKSPVENEDACLDSRQKDGTGSDSEDDDNPPRTRKAQESVGVVECLTISSDDEEEEAEESDQHVSSHSDASDISTSLMNKEPPLIDAYDDAKLSDSEMDAGERESGTKLDMTSGPGYFNLNCRTVRIGSYKFIPRSPVTVSEYGIRIDVPAINRPSETIVVKIPTDEITKVLIHSGRKLPVMFYYVSVQMGARVRSLLNMTNKSECYFNPHSRDDSQRRITLVLEKFSESSGSCITELYLDRNLLEDLSFREANALLVKSSPQERKDVQKLIKQVPPNPVQTIMVYPPPPAKGGISINTEDYSCLAEDVFLNDVIIDFYLKWLYNEKLSQQDKEKTHIFSSFFYKRLTDKATPIPRDLQTSRTTDSTISPAEIRHSRVSKWTKNIDLFSKDYIIIPLNENQHWFLAIVCFPGLTMPVRFADNKPIETSSPAVKIENADSSTEDPDSETMFIGSTTITPIRADSGAKFTVEEDGGDADERDEADGAEEDVNLYLPTSEDSDAEYSETELASSEDVKPAVPHSKPEKEPIKQPCILVFDSLAGASRARIIATLRDYLRVEYKAKHNEERDFSKLVVKGACPRVPQQNNYTDCGLFVLQYVESFFENKITDFHIPIKSLRNWFDPDIVGNKRYEIQQLLLRLMVEQNIDVDSLKLPPLNLSLHSGEDSNDEFEDGYDDLDDEDEYYEEDGDDDEMDDEDLEDDDVGDEHDGDLDHPFGYRNLEDTGDDVEVGNLRRRTFRASCKRERLYRFTDQPRRLRQPRRHAPQPLSGDEPDYIDNDLIYDDEFEGYDDVGDDSRSNFELYGAEFDVDNEDSPEDQVDANAAISDADIVYQGLDNVDVMKTRKRSADPGNSSTLRRSCRGISPTSKGRMEVAAPPGKGIHRERSAQLVNYDDDDDDNMDDEVSGGLVNDDEAEGVEGLQTVDDGEDVRGLEELIEGDEKVKVDDEDSRRRLASANERLCALNPDSVTVSVTRCRSANLAKDSSIPATNSISPPAGDRSTIASLKAARPFGDIESSDSPCSSAKKFRSN